MAYPSGSGSERLIRGAMLSLSSAATAFKFDGTSPTVGTASYTVPTNHIITILSITWTELGVGTTNFVLYSDISSVEYKFLQSHYINEQDTYVWDDKIVLHPGDSLKTYCPAQGSASMDVYYSYIDQDWT